jgi:serine/threonine protein kinase
MILAGRFRLARKLGEGAFGCIYLCQDEQGKQYALKLEKDSGQLGHEADVYSRLEGVFGFPEVAFRGEHEGMIVLVVELLGPCLDRLKGQCGNRLSQHSVGLIGHQIVTRLESLHRKGLVHRDIKPENMLLRDRDSRLIYLIDFGLAAPYRD